ncbi:hypothetical protein ABEW05_004348 [Botrytis cinerea]
MSWTMISAGSWLLRYNESLSIRNTSKSKCSAWDEDLCPFGEGKSRNQPRNVTLQGSPLALPTSFCASQRIADGNALPFGFS